MWPRRLTVPLIFFRSFSPSEFAVSAPILTIDDCAELREITVGLNLPFDDLELLLSHALPGIAGFIVAVGITADSFIVFFERIRDEVRDGRTIRSAVDAGWERASRTILAGDAVTLLAAGVLWALASSNVRGFAFTLGLTTIIDLIIVFFFTKPMMQWLTRRKFFGDGHRLSGLNPELLGARNPMYAGRGRVRGLLTEGAQA